MKPKTKRLCGILGSLVAAGAGVFLLSQGLKESLVYFYSPTQLQTATVASDQIIRVGGLVKEGSYALEIGSHVFDITDEKNTISVVYKGILPALFREGQGVIVEGYLHEALTFQATRVLAKHDENYMPKEVYDALREGKGGA